jgi:hypothetical protein
VKRLRILAAATLVVLSACRSGGLRDADAEKVVRRYCEKVVEAYRTSDAEIMDPLVGDAQGKKLTALIGAKRDMGVVLDAVLHELALEKVERSGDEVLVVTRERWEYRDRAIGSGEQAGPSSNDRYQLRYHLGPRKDGWIVNAIEFVEPPVVERGPEPLPGADPRQMHGLAPRADR